MDLRRVFLWMTISSLAAAALFGIAALVLPESDVTWRILASVTTIGVFSLTALLLAFSRGIHTAPQARVLATVGLVLGGAGCLLWFVVIWVDLYWTTGETIARSAGVCTALTIAAMHSLLVTTPAAVNPTRMLQFVSAASGGLVGLMFTWVLVTDDFSETLGRAIGVGVIVAIACGGIAFIVWKAVPTQRLRRTPVSTRPRFDVRVRCPRCGGEHPLAVGEGHCPTCDLAIAVKIDEPTCACGYPILGLAADVCPECGTAIPDDQRWALGEVSGPPAS